MSGKRLLTGLALLALALFVLTPTVLAEAVPVNATVASIDALSKTLAPGDSFVLSKINVFPAGMDEPLFWKTSNSGVATITGEDGLASTTVTAVKNGRATISLMGTRSGLTLAKCQVTVRTVKITSFTISPKSLSLAPGREYTLSANIKPSNATYNTVSWTTSDPSVLSFDPVGMVSTASGRSVKVTAHALGKVTILAVTDTGRRQSCIVTVKDLTVTSVKFSKSKITVYKEDPAEINLSKLVTVSPSTAADTTVTYDSVNKLVAEIDPSSGILKPLTTGTTVITATAGGKTGKCTVTVSSKAIKSVSISTPDDAAVVLDVGATAQLKANVSPAYAADRGIGWTSDDPLVATVDDTGLVTAVAGGITRVNVTSVANSKIKASVTIRVRGGSDYRTVTITSAGDTVLGGDQRSSRYAANPRSFQLFKNAIFLAGDNGVSGDGTVFTRVHDYFAGENNISTLNLEGTLTLKDTRDDRKPFAFQGDPAYAQTMLKAHGIDTVSLANNHTYDVGEDGYKGTMRALDKKSVKYYGNGMTCYIKSENGVRVAFLGFVSKTVMMGSMRTQIQRASKRSDLVVVMFHWTDVTEFKYAQPTGRQRSIAYAAINAGADLVLGAHTHRLNGVERYKGKYIVYDMGNFVTIAANPLNKFGPSNPRGKYDYDSMIYQQKFNIWSDGFIEPAAITIIPCAITSSPKALVNDAQPMPYTDSEDIDRVKSIIESHSPSDFSKYPITFTH